jgi:hypothetical protein
MAVTKFKTTSSFTNLTKYDSFLAGNAAYSPSSYESIASATGTGSSGTITFSSIPSTYTSLQIRMIGRSSITGTATVSGRIQINGDASSASYTSHMLFGEGTTAQVDAAASGTYTGVLLPAPRDGNTASIFGANVIDIHNYTSTTQNKTIRAFSGIDLNGAGGAVYLQSGLWLSTAAITSVSLVLTTSNWTTGSTFALYGIKG